MENNNNSSIVYKIIGGVLVIALLAFAVIKLRDDKAGDLGDQTPTPTTPPSATPPPAAITRKYKDGAYTASGNYTSPAQKEEIRIELVIKDDVVAAATFFENPSNPTTKTMQEKFKAGFQEAVVGKNVDDLNLTVVNGSSLTPKGFMDALNKIKTQALNQA